MASLQISDAFKRYGARLKNVQWSVSAWTADGALVACLWSHHYRKSVPGAMEFADSFARWSGPGNAEFRRNVIKAFAEQNDVRLVMVTAKNTEDQKRIQSGDVVTGIPKDYVVRDDVIGKVMTLDGDSYSFRFTPIAKVALRT